MHDLDRAMFEAEETEMGTADEQEHEEFLANLRRMGSRNGSGGRRPYGPGYRTAPSATDLASRLLEVQGEEELDQFLGSMLNTAVGAVRNFAGSNTGKALTGMLKKAAGTALPVLGGAAGSYVGQTAGGAVRDWLGWELEGLSEEDREFEIAKAFTRFATAAARQAARAPSGASPEAVARAAAVTAARRHAPAFLDWLGGGGRGRQAVSESEYEYEYESGEVDSETELARQLLEITSEEELDQFLGKVFKSVARTVGQAVRSPVGQALGGALKGIARQALPVVGGAVGSFVAPGAGTAIGSALGSAAARMFELELESMDEQEAEFEVARRFVRLASAAAKHAARAPRDAAPNAVATAAIRAAARRHAPGLVAQGRGPGRPGRRRDRRGGYGIVLAQAAGDRSPDDAPGERCVTCGSAAAGED